MRRTRCWRSVVLLALPFTAANTSLAQEFVPLSAPPVEAARIEAAPVAVERHSSSGESRAILDRLERQEQELRALRSSVNERTPAQEASFAADAAADEKAADGPCKQVEIVSKPSFAIYGRFFFDHIMFEDDPALVAATGVDRLNETGFNTIRLGAKGNIYENVIGQIEVEFEGTEVDYKDCFIEANNAPILGNVRVGHFRENFSLEELTSSRFITFMQRSIPHSALVPSRNFGVMAYNDIAENENWTWFAGAYRHDSPDNPAARASHIADEGDWAFTGRLAGLLFYDEPSQGRYLVHVGGAYSARNDLTVVSFASRPELGSQAGYLTSTFTGDDTYELYGAEFAVVWGPSSFQTEYYVADPGAGEIHGGYAQYSYFITGENRAYNRHHKVFDRVKPLEDFFRVETAEGVCMGRGAWELKARYSWLDMNDGLVGIRGDQDDFSAGANWYWNPYTRMMFDYVYEDVSLLTGVQGSNSNVGMRFQFDF